MSQNPIRVHLFKLFAGKESTPLQDILEQAKAHTLEERIRKLGNQRYRLEAAEPPTDAHPFWLLDFGKFRFDGGPGRASNAAPIESFDMAANEWFAEETAALIDTEHGYLVIQYNHHGARAGSIGEYLSTYDVDHVNDYDFRICLNRAAQARLDRKKIFTKLEVKVAPANLSDSFKKANVSLTTALKRSQQDFGGDHVSITVGLEQASNSRLKIAKWIGAFKSLAGEGHAAVKTLAISGRDGDDSAIDLVDLIREKLEFSFKDVRLDTGRRYVREDRWDRLTRAYNQWKREKLIG